LFAHGEDLGAVYLFGYSIEIRLKVAYYRTIGLVPSSAIDIKLHRKPAEDAIDAMHLPRPPLRGRPPGHDVVGWALLLEQARAAPGNIPMDPAVVTRMHAHVDNVFLCWVEFLRYRANKPYNGEVTAVRNAARWFRANAASLWR
jgi:hypothetical protein